MGTRAALRLMILTAMGTVVIASANADSLVLASVGTARNPNQTNSNGPTIPIKRNAAWASAFAGSSWVSFAPTGDATNPNFKVVPTGTVVSFFDVFKIAETATGGTLRIMAADSVSVILNGVAICAESSPRGNSDAICSDTEIGYRKAVTIHLPAKLLHLGSNRLEFRVAQRKGASLGLDYAGKVNFNDAIYPVNGLYFASGRENPIPVPEPSSLAMLCAGILALVALALLGTKKNAT